MENVALMRSVEDVALLTQDVPMLFGGLAIVGGVLCITGLWLTSNGKTRTAGLALLLGGVGALAIFGLTMVVGG